MLCHTGQELAESATWAAMGALAGLSATVGMGNQGGHWDPGLELEGLRQEPADSAQQVKGESHPS